jgi:hypothetical protein
VQLGFTAIAVGVVFWAYRFRRGADPQILTALFLACSVFGLPYLLSYDTLTLTVAVVVLVANGKLDATGRVLARLVYWLPLIKIMMGTLHVPGGGLIAPAFAVYLVMRLREGRAPAPTAMAQPA